MFQLAVLLTCQMPFRFGLPSARRGMALADCARVEVPSDVAITAPATAPASTEISATWLVVEKDILQPVWVRLKPDATYCSRCLHRLDSQQRSRGFVSQQIQKTVGSLANLANPLFELRQKRLTPRRQALLIQHDELQLLANERTDEHAAFPRGEFVSRVDRHPRKCRRRRPEENRRLHFGRERLRLLRTRAAGHIAAVRSAQRNHRPPVVFAR